MGFQQGLSGLNSASKFLDVVGNNVANANTVGFKGSRAEFADVYANTLASTNVQVGIGGRTSNVAQQFAQGNITSTSNPLDIAIQGNGFFRMIDPAGSFSYARNGQFQLDRDGYIVNNGQKLAGYGVNPSTNQLITGATPAAIQIKTSNIGAQATGGSSLADAGLTLGMNFDARSPIVNRGTSTVSVTGAKLNNAAAVNTVVGPYTIRTTDSTGQFHSLQVQLKNTGPQTWSVETQLDGSGTFTPTATPLIFAAPAAGGQLSSGGTQAVSFNLPSPAPAYGTTPFNFNLNFAGAQEVVPASVALGTITANDPAALNTTIQIAGSNLDPSAPAATVQTYTGSYLDPVGNSVSYQVNLTKTGTNTWVPTLETPIGTPFAIVPAPTSLVFNSAGQLLSGSPVAVANAPAASANKINFNIDFGGITQKTGAFTAGTTTTRSTPAAVPSDPTTYTHSTSATVYDSQGIAHTLTSYFTKVAVNAWEVQTSFDGGKPVTQPGYVTFDASGKLNGGDKLSYTSPIPSPSGAQTPLAFAVYFTGTTQFGNQFGVNTLSQDGYADGNITGLSIGKDGIILGRYSNGQNRTIGQITLYNFANPQGLQPLGDNRWAETFASNQARLGTPGTSDFGSLQSGAVEDSNIDLTKELVDMITAQRSYQANAQTIKTQDSVLQTLVNLR